MLNKCILVPVLILKLKTALAIKSGLTLFGLGLGAGYFFNYVVRKCLAPEKAIRQRHIDWHQNPKQILQREKAQKPK